MKRKKVFSSARRILLLALGVFLFLLGVKALFQVSETSDRLNAAVYVADATVFPENEGKLVIVAGTVRMTAPAFDPAYGITLDTPSAERYDQYYDNITNGKWDWRTASTVSVVGQAAIGQFTISESILAKFPVDSYYDAFDANETAAYHVWPDLGGETYLAESNVMSGGTEDFRTALNALGDHRFYYRYWNTEECSEMTLVGIQQGNTLIQSDESGGATVNTGILSQEEVSGNEERIGVISTLIFGFLGGLVCIFFAFKGVLYLKKERLSRRAAEYKR